MDLLGICPGIKCGTIVAVFFVMAGISCSDILYQSSSYQKKTVVSTRTGKKHCYRLSPNSTLKHCFLFDLGKAHTCKCLLVMPLTVMMHLRMMSHLSFLTVRASFCCRYSSSPRYPITSPSAPFRIDDTIFPLIIVPPKWVYMDSLSIVLQISQCRLQLKRLMPFHITLANGGKCIQQT